MVLFASVGLLLAAGCGNSTPTRPASSTPGTTPAPATSPTQPQAPATTHTPGANHVQLPATFHLRPGGFLDPTEVSAPASVPVVVTVYNYDQRIHRVTVNAPPKTRSLAVAPGGHASARLEHLPKGRYPILVDGVVRSHLVIGVQPGP